MFRWERIAAVPAGAVLILVTAAAAGNATVGRPRAGQASCPRSTPLRVPHNDWRLARRHLAPRGAERIELCRYASKHRTMVLAGSAVVIGSKTIHRLTTRFDSLKPYHGPPRHCRGYLGNDLLATLFYRHGHRVAINIGDVGSGCEDATNGDIDRPVFPFKRSNRAGPKLEAEIERLTQH